MKQIDIALKDLSQAFRSMFALAFMFGIPILVTGLFYLFFSGIMGGDEQIDLPQTKVVIVNLDAGSPEFLTGVAQNMSGTELSGFDLSGVDSMGDVLVRLLQSESFASLIEVGIEEDPQTARSLVDTQQAGVAVIIPENFTQVLAGYQEQAAVELYKDPTLTIGPAIVQSMLSQFMDYASSMKIGMNVTMEQLADAGLPLDSEAMQALAMQFMAAQSGGNQSEGSLLDIKSPDVAKKAQNNELVRLLSIIMGGMMVFYAFFTGASSAESILREEEKGTLSRLFTTPTSVNVILSGKFLYITLTVLVQVIVLLIFSSLVFGINWGEISSVALVAVGMVIASASFGIFLVSLMKSTRQAGTVFGGALTVSGMVAVFPSFASFSGGGIKSLGIVSLLFPQGWVMRSLMLTLEGSSFAILLPTLAVIVVVSLVFFIVGSRRMQKRFA